MNSVRSNSLSLKYQRVTSSGSKDIGLIKFKFVAKTQFQIKLGKRRYFPHFWSDKGLKGNTVENL